MDEAFAGTNAATVPQSGGFYLNYCPRCPATGPRSDPRVSRESKDSVLRYAALMEENQIAEKHGTAGGLCADCVHVRHIESDRKSVFILCNLSLTDPRFPKYPRLPVLSCDGYKKKP